MKLVVIDDDPQNLKLGQFVLADEKLEIHTVSDPHLFLFESIRDHSFPNILVAAVRPSRPRCALRLCAEYMSELVAPIANGSQDFVLVSRTRGQGEPGT
jgi:CheY-like chemotaxis protein